MKRIRITSERLNSYGSRVLTGGMDIEQYKANPVLLYMHNRGDVIGYMRDLEVNPDGTITAEPVFDEATDLSKRCKAQYEFGSLRMASVGIDIVELSEDSAVLVPGQTRATVTKSKLYEVSLVDVGANDDAIVLRREGQEITLGKGGDSLLPILTNINPKDKEMDIKELALMMGMPETATEEEVKAKLKLMKEAASLEEQHRVELEKLELAAITAAVDRAVADRRLGAEKKEQFVTLGKKAGIEELNKVLDAMQPQVKLSGMLSMGGDGGSRQGEYAKLSEVPADELMKLRSEKPDAYKRLYEAEYGMACEM